MASQLPPGIDLSMIPAAIPPSGVTPNFVDPPSLADVVEGVSITFLVITALVVGARVVTNVTGKRVAGIDDAFCMIAFVGCAAYTGVSLSVLKYFRHQWDIPFVWFDAKYFKTSYAAQIILYPTTFFSKLSIFLLYRRIFASNNNQNMKWFIYGGIAFSFCLYAPNVVIASWFCAPHAGKSWEFQNLLHCKDGAGWYVAQACLILILDLYIFILPLPTLLKLKMSRHKKISIMIVFMTAILAIIAAAATLANRPFLLKSADQTWYAGIAVVCSSVEIYVSVIVSSAPAISCFLQHFITDSALYSNLRSRLLSTTGRTSKSKTEHSGNSWSRSRTNKPSNDSTSRLQSDSIYINLESMPDASVYTDVQRGHSTEKPNHGIVRSVDVSQGYEDRHEGRNVV